MRKMPVISTVCTKRRVNLSYKDWCSIHEATVMTQFGTFERVQVTCTALNTPGRMLGLYHRQDILDCLKHTQIHPWESNLPAGHFTCAGIVPCDIQGANHWVVHHNAEGIFSKRGGNRRRNVTWIFVWACSTRLCCYLWAWPTMHTVASNAK